MESPIKNLIYITALILIAAAVLARRIIILKLRKKHFRKGTKQKRAAYMFKLAEQNLMHLKVYQNDLQYMEFAGPADRRFSPKYFRKGEFIEFTNTVL